MLLRTYLAYNYLITCALTSKLRVKRIQAGLPVINGITIA